MKVFARMVIRLIGTVTEQDIENEANAISVLCTGAQCKFVVEVLQHGWLTGDHSCYFIDMEYYIQMLEDFIKEIANKSQDLQHSEMEQLNNFMNPERTEAMNLAMLISVVETSPMKTEGVPSAADLIELDNEQNLAPILPIQASSNSEDSRALSSSEKFLEDELIDWETLITVLKDIASGLIYIHSHKFVHRDLKPRNGSYC